MKLIVGLGNPGSQYERTRHNAGFMAVDLFARTHQAAGFRNAHESFVCDVLVGTEKILLQKPMTYMNLSGRAVASVLAFYKLSIFDLLVISDDIALPVGTIRLRTGGSSGGHNGLSDIARAMTNFALAAEGESGEKILPTDYNRLRIGIDSPGKAPQKAYVLEAFSANQLTLLEGALNKAMLAMEAWATEGIGVAMNKYNGMDKGF